MSQRGSISNSLSKNIVLVSSRILSSESTDEIGIDLGFVIADENICCSCDKL